MSNSMIFFLEFKVNITLSIETNTGKSIEVGMGVEWKLVLNHLTNSTFQSNHNFHNFPYSMCATL